MLNLSEEREKIKIYGTDLSSSNTTPAEDKKDAKLIIRQVEYKGLIFNTSTPKLPKKGFLIGKNPIIETFFELITTNRNSKSKIISVEKNISMVLPTIKDRVDAEKPLNWRESGATEIKIKMSCPNEYFKKIDRDTIICLLWLINSFYYNINHNKGLNTSNKLPNLQPFKYFDYLKMMKISPSQLPIRSYKRKNSRKIHSLAYSIGVLAKVCLNVSIPKLSKEFNCKIVDAFDYIDLKPKVIVKNTDGEDENENVLEEFMVGLDYDFIVLCFLLEKSFFNLTSTLLNFGKKELSKVILTYDLESHELFNKTTNKKLHIPHLKNVIPNYVEFLMSDKKHLTASGMREKLLSDFKALYDLDFFEKLEFIKDGEILTINDIKVNDLKGVDIDYTINKNIELEREFTLNHIETPIEIKLEREKKYFI